uniref:Uncharacterized protein n=1 Tax=Rhizophora mucronata TaxID=61149 RepID=A0A2P2PAJ1_RHIMU
MFYVHLATFYVMISDIHSISYSHMWREKLITNACVGKLS